MSGLQEMIAISPVDMKKQTQKVEDSGTEWNAGLVPFSEECNMQVRVYKVDVRL